MAAVAQQYYEEAAQNEVMGEEEGVSNQCFISETRIRFLTVIFEGGTVFVALVCYFPCHFRRLMTGRVVTLEIAVAVIVIVGKLALWLGRVGVDFILSEIRTNI